MKNIGVFLSENFQFLEMKFSIYLNRRVFVMGYEQGLSHTLVYKQAHSISYKIAYAPRKDSDQPAHLCSLIRVLTGHSVGSHQAKSDD